jgi:uncharacterized lipoprotein YmbA
MKPTNQLFLLAAAAAIMAGCSSPSSRFYTLNSTATGDGKSHANYTLAVGPVSVPMEVDHPQFTIQVTTNRVAVDEFNRWAEPLNNNIARVVAADLATLLGTPRVAAAPLANFKPDYRVTIEIQKFISDPGKMVRIDALWVVSKAGGENLVSGHTVSGEQATDDSRDALAAAHSRALAKVSLDIAAAIRASVPKPAE